MKEGRKKQFVRAGWLAALIAVISLSTGCAVVRRVIKFPFWLITAEVEDTEHFAPVAAPTDSDLHEKIPPLLMTHIMPEFQTDKNLLSSRLASSAHSPEERFRTN